MFRKYKQGTNTEWKDVLLQYYATILKLKKDILTVCFFCMKRVEYFLL